MKDKNKSCIYCIENKTTYKKYIGQSKDINDRWRRHISELDNNSHYNDYLQKSWNKYGKDDFDFYVLEHCSIEQLDKKEIYYIDYYNTMNGDCGYNLKSGGQFKCNTYSEETRKKISESIKKTYLDPERRKIQSVNALNQWNDPKIKEKITGSNNGMYGKHHTEESKKKISDNNKGKQSWRRNLTPVKCIELNKIFNDATTAGNELSIKGYSILKVCQGKRQTCGGYHWEFINTEEKIENIIGE